MIGTVVRCCWFAAFTCALLAACGDPPEDAARSAASGGKTASKASSVVDNMVAAVSAGKSSTVVGVHFSLGNAPTVNTALPIDIAVVPHRDFTSLRARITAQDGITIISGDQLPEVSGISAEKPIEHKLVVMPVKAGVYMITVNLETGGDDGAVSRIFSIPVIVEPVAPAAAAPGTTPAPAGPAPTNN